MRNKKSGPSSIWMPKADMVELVEPHDLEDVLSTLQAHGIIGEFQIGQNLVWVFPIPGRRFDLALYLAETTERTGRMDMPDSEPQPTQGTFRKAR